MVISFFKFIMSLSPQKLLSSAARERCIANLKQLPFMVHLDLNHTPNTKASVLVPLCVVDGEVCLLYTLRSSNLKSHSGQVSFPGGKMDGSETTVETALRETEEEIGVSPRDVDIWGEMKPVLGRNKDMLITPVVGEIKNFDMNRLVQNFNEVEEIFTVPMSVLCNPDSHAYLEYKPPLPLFIHGKHHIWGITGLITHLFLQCFLEEDLYKPNFMRKKFNIDQLMPAKL